MFLYIAKDYEGTLNAHCTEGTLCWVDNYKINSLPMWEGDACFDSFLNHHGFVEAKFTYENDHLIEKIIHYY